MRVKALRDAKGRIVATVDPTPNPLVQVEPVVEDGKIEEIEAPQDYEFSLQPFYKKLEKPVKKK